ncbi:DUF4232 domain-containing protein [Streptomyces griseoruber]|uniref:DUF4232 domain-containing protein n=1 Tax=Streptomyces griseoruber TaxID=1943 RepID=UPI0006E2C8F0|nr:DUF4232 domain-containing protein [Streptomyces griseoruber]
MRRPTRYAVAVLLLVGAAGCSSGPDAASDASPEASSSEAGYVPRAGSGADPDASPGADAGDAGDSTGDSGEKDAGAGQDTSAPSAGVLYGAGSLPSPAADHCRTQHLTAVARSTGEGRASVVLTNKGDGSCTVRGFPSLLFEGRTGRTELPVDWAGSAAEAPKVTLGPGDSAVAALTFTSLGECDAITALDVVPPGESRPLTPAFTTSEGKEKAVRVCDTGVRVRAFTTG